MADKTSEWRPGPTVCRCCLAEGCYKDISTEYFWMGKREVYAEMLAETFSVSIAYSKSGGPNSNSRLICEPCISRLRDASDFKKQVQECEKTFMQYLDPGSSSTTLESEVQTSSTDKRVKVEQVKIERQFSDDEFDSRDFGDDDDDDDMDQPLTTFASKEPKKETVNLMELLASPQLSVKRKAPAQTKTVSVKKVKVIKKDARGKPTTSKAAQKNEDKKKKEKACDPITVARRNAELIVKYSTVYPFRLPDTNMVCVYCAEGYEVPTMFRRHMETEHQLFNPRMAFAHLPEGYIKVDCTDIRCRICSEHFVTLEEIGSHLQSVHYKHFDLNTEIGAQPFKFENDRFKCSICNKKTLGLRQLSRHMHTHFLKYTCDSCGKSYATNTALRAHTRYTHSREGHICRKCKTSFSSAEALRAHRLESRRCWQYLCNVCGERFVNWELKENHRREIHGVEKRAYNCLECGESFACRKKFQTHFKVSHTDDSYMCPFCGVKFPTRRILEDHRVVHTKEKLFPCMVCLKAFSRKKNLVQHMWMHSEYKRFECKMCNKQFNQRVSWKSHMKSYHPDLSVSEQQGKNNNTKLLNTE
ncbi:zinc finger protein 660-like isoform X11 [Bombyx mori]|uniref:Uncharacterized protein n=1 Tax=Bombyx mori TaxID=7091 RepID=A0A8R2R4P4_BOMMO|nr:ferritin isoform X10 [Bombyx mori]